MTDLLARLRAAFVEISKFATVAVSLRDAGFTTEAIRWPRDPLALKLLCAWNNLLPEKAPPGWAYHPNDKSFEAWERVAATAREEAAARIEAMAGEVEGLREALAMAIPRNVCLTNRNIADSYVVPIEVTMGELRSMAAALTAPSMKENEDETRG